MKKCKFKMPTQSFLRNFRKYWRTMIAGRMDRSLFYAYFRDYFLPLITSPNHFDLSLVRIFQPLEAPPNYLFGPRETHRIIFFSFSTLGRILKIKTGKLLYIYTHSTMIVVEDGGRRTEDGGDLMTIIHQPPGKLESP